MYIKDVKLCIESQKQYLCFVKIYLIFYSESFLTWPYPPDQPNKPLATVGMFGCDLYLHAKNLRHQLNTSKDTDDQRILQFDWTGAFWPITCEPAFSDMGFAQENKKLGFL